MKRCPKGHQYPDKLDECPVCAKDNELQTVFAYTSDRQTTIIPPASPVTDNAPPASINVVPQQQPAPPAESEVDKTVILQRQPLAEKNILTGWIIELDFQDMPVNSYQIFNKKITIGRRSSNDIILQDDSVSGIHCSIEFQNGKFIIQDNNSANQTIIDGQAVSSQTLEEDNIILLGRSKFKIKYL